MTGTRVVHVQEGHVLRRAVDFFFFHQHKVSIFFLNNLDVTIFNLLADLTTYISYQNFEALKPYKSAGMGTIR